MLDIEKKLVIYREFVLRKASEKNDPGRLIQSVIGLSTEAGELLDALKKQMFHGRPIDITNVKEECGDSFFYFTELLVAIGSNLSVIMDISMGQDSNTNNIAKQLVEYHKFVLEKASEKTAPGCLVQGIIEMSAESGKILDDLKKQMFYSQPMDISTTILRCADSFFFFIELLIAIDCDLSEIIDMNIAKLDGRYKKGFSTIESVGRDLDNERKILEQNEKGAKDETD